MQSSKEQQEEIRKPSSVINAKKQRKTTEWERETHILTKKQMTDQKSAEDESERKLEPN